MKKKLVAFLTGIMTVMSIIPSGFAYTSGV